MVMPPWYIINIALMESSCRSIIVLYKITIGSRGLVIPFKGLYGKTMVIYNGKHDL